MEKIVILGISAFYHDSAAAIIIDGKIIAAAEEERFTRKKHDPSFPLNAIKYCLKEAQISLNEVQEIVFQDNPRLKFNRLLMTHISYAPKGFRTFRDVMEMWLGGKLYCKNNIRIAFQRVSPISLQAKISHIDHHLSHAASAFYPSPFNQAAILCLDGVGEWDCSTAWEGNDTQLTKICSMHFPHSVGILYSSFTYYTGFKVNAGEYKLMGLAPYGQPKYVNKILDNLLDLKEDGSFRLNMEYFDFPINYNMINKKFENLFGGAARKPETEITQRDMDIARSIQYVTEEIILKIAKHIYQELALDNLCLAGGVALNCVANGRIVRELPFKHVWIQPAAGDAGGALGAALWVWNNKHVHYREREVSSADMMNGAFLGPQFSQKEVVIILKNRQAKFIEFEDDDQLISKVAELLSTGNVIGWIQGRMEFGPRALGARSILADPRSASMQAQLNLKIKYRESFRPFAPAVKKDKASEWFDLRDPSPYMLLAVPVKKEKLLDIPENTSSLLGFDRLKVKRSEIPAVTHVDYSARVQTVDPLTNLKFYKLISKFEELTQCPILINTSFNVRGEPIVCSPEDAYHCFLNTEMDYLVIENCLLDKKEQNISQQTQKIKQVFDLD